MTFQAIQEYSFDWVSVPSDNAPCLKCEIPIIGQMFHPVVVIGEVENLDFNPIDVKLCKWCYEVNIL